MANLNFPDIVKMMMMDTPGDSSSRFEKSLGLLTTKFVTLLQEAEGGILDLKVVRQIFRIFKFIGNGQTVDL